ncbi:MAG: histidinol-phosphatase [Bacteroidetes bacterium HGW-Bacteroidetes-22]|nr:MAG: histidinol-phosphatase [Bacteroidetes bacterium HGW-Bacteroidetes-22]
MKKYNILIAIMLSAIQGMTQEGARQSFHFPDVNGYQVLKADLHTHSVFSDGMVWPSLRVEEAWREGLDIIAITEHIEYRPNKADVNGDHNRSFAIAKEQADKAGILVIPGSEITRKMPPGHFNALFITDANKLEVPDWKEAFREARRQGAFIFWNHPGWKAQQPDSARWMPEHQMLFDSGYMEGIEIANYEEWYPSALRWALNRNLTLLGNSDIHGAIYQQYEVHKGKHRPITLIFAKNSTLTEIHEALKQRRTAVLFDGMVIGREEWLTPMIKSTIEVNPYPSASTESRITMVLENKSDLDVMLYPTPQSIAKGVIYPVAIPARSKVLLSLRLKDDEMKAMPSHTVQMTVKDWYTKENTTLTMDLTFKR